MQRTKGAADMPPLGEAVSSPWGAWCAILAVAICGNLLIALSPIFWGGFSEYMGFSDALIGEIMSSEYSGATLATVAGIFYIHRSSMDLRKITFAALAIYAVGNYLTPSVMHDPALLKAMRFVCGIASGTTFVAAAAVVPGQKYAARLIPIFYGTPYIAGFVLQPMLPTVFANWGFDNSFKVMAAVAALGLLTYRYFPRHASDHSEAVEEGAARAQSLPALVIIGAALLLQYIANSGLWLFFERVGVVSGHSAQTAASVVGLGTGMALIGTALATVLSKRFRSLNAILLGTGLMAFSVIMLHFSGSLSIYVGAISLFNIMTTFVTPFYFILLLRVFQPAKSVVVGNIAIMVGFSLGPLFTGYSVHDDNFSVAINATLVLLALSVVLLGIYAFGFGSARQPGSRSDASAL